MKKEHAKARKAMEQRFASKEAEVRELAARNRELEKREKRQATPIRNPFPPKRLRADVVDFEGFNMALRSEPQEDQKDPPDAAAAKERDISNIKNVDPDVMAQKWLQELITRSTLQNIGRGQSVQQALGNVALQLLPEIQKLEVQHHSIVALRLKNTLEQIQADTVANEQLLRLNRYLNFIDISCSSSRYLVEKRLYIMSLQREIVEHIINHGAALISDDWTSGSGKSMLTIAAIWSFVEAEHAELQAKQASGANKPQEQKVPERAHWDDSTLKDVPKQDIILNTTYIFSSVPVMTEESTMATFILWVLHATRTVMLLDTQRHTEPAKEMVWRNIMLHLTTRIPEKFCAYKMMVYEVSI